MMGTVTHLGTSHQVSVGRDDRDRVLLNWGGSRITSETDVFKEDRVERRARETEDGLWNASARSLHGDVVVFLKVYPGVLLGGIFRITEQFLFNAQIATANDVFAVPPISLAKDFARLRVPAGGSLPICRARGGRRPVAQAGPRKTRVTATPTSIRWEIRSTMDRTGCGTVTGTIPAVPIAMPIQVSQHDMHRKREKETNPIGGVETARVVEDLK
jgi:hypothetical protein